MASLLAMTCVASSAQPSSRGGNYHSESDSFTVQFPTAPTVIPGSQNGAPGKDYQAKSSRYAFSILVTSRKGNTSSTADDRETLLANVAMAREALGGPKVVEESQANAGRYAGVELVAPIDGQRVRLKVFVSGSHIYTLTAISQPGDSISDVLSNLFFDSFEITE